MTKKIFKYPLKIDDEQMIEVPEDGKFINVQTQDDIVCLWALVDPHAKIVKRAIHIYGTGHPIELENLEYIGTTQQLEGKLIWHVFERIPADEYFVNLAKKGIFG